MLKEILNKLFRIVVQDIRNGIISYDKSVFPSRLFVITSCFAFCYLAIAIKLFNVAIFYDDDQKITYSYKNLSQRKDVVDRNGSLLATNLSTVSIYANPRKILDADKAAIKLARVLPEYTVSKLKEKLVAQKSFVWIKRNITPKEQQKINNLAIPGIYYEFSEKRAYPYGNLFSHALGYVGLDGTGLSGIEKQHDKFLRQGDKATSDKLELTLDARIQNIAREELKKAVKEYNAAGGAAIVQDPNNGEILALVSLPDYDPHSPGRAPNSALFNRATLGSYEIGSIFKIFTVAAALDKGAISLNNAYDVSKPIYFSKHTIKDFLGKGGMLSVPEILMYSSNIGTVQIAFELGKKYQYEYLKSLGFLSKINIDYPEVSSPNYPNIEKWSSVNAATISYGHGISISLLQAIRAFNAVINGGYLFNSHLTKSPQTQENIAKVLNDNTSSQMKKLLRVIVAKGAGRRSEVKGYYVGGKSGTANKAINGSYSKTARVSSFIAAFPIHDPKYTVLVTLDEPKGTKNTFGFATGSWTAAPAVAQIIKRIAHVHNIPMLSDSQIEKGLAIEYDTGDKTKFL